MHVQVVGAVGSVQPTPCSPSTAIRVASTSQDLACAPSATIADHRFGYLSISLRDTGDDVRALEEHTAVLAG
jgi:hypothetical protein